MFILIVEASHIQTLEYDLKYLGTNSYDLNNPIYEPSRIIIDLKDETTMAKCNTDICRNRHAPIRYHYVHQGTLNKHKFG